MRSILPETDSTMRMSTENAVDTSDFSKKRKEQTIINRRGAFHWLPVAMANDLVHGSWYFVWGSTLYMLFPIMPLINMYHPFIPDYSDEDDTPFPLLKKDITYSLLIFSGFLFTLGSLMFVRATDEPRVTPLFDYYHCATDELLGAWLYFFGSLPAIPYALMYLMYHWNGWSYWGAFFLAILSVIGCFLFVMACYPTPKVCRHCFVVAF